MLAVYEQLAKPGQVRLCFDERPCQLLDEVVTALPHKPDRGVPEDNEYKRKGTCVVLLAYDLDTGQRYVQVRQQSTKADYAQFIQDLIQIYYAKAERIELVQDNLNTHKYGSFYKHIPLAQARALNHKLSFQYTPKHGSWLNMAEPGGWSH
ncbi:transposase [Rudanella paleaurantiibacter]|uniref:transposase n=1 Tax=Rudanella paleaurantiibacter TaxID=2614655 RepID=UPI001FE6FB6C|nr:transposase [Rudanella paleaurantiibacter]